ncbi:matrix metalloproteinase-25 isoform X1 [Podarcis raffonei]|uniref:matrix metalloproteinase-25 isoform X1 n=2 Tax=Podarcis raffonei TaxID=65483 RepID=UPI0023297DA9|nr:matrix metalloproteinase-25 isoform X1 [Podarcis raffonei]
MLLLLASLCLWTFPQTRAAPSSTQEMTRGLEWLTRYGYLPQPDPRAARLQSPEELKSAIRTMQRFAGLPVTGTMDQKTLDMMSHPRCSLPDIIGTSELMRRRRRRRRYALSDSVWTKTSLTWHIRSFPRTSQLNPYKVRELISLAFRAWSRSSALTFREDTSGQADIVVDFSRSYHEDSYPFDGPGGTLAHAFFPGEHPISGDTHFDDEETWIHDPDNKYPGQGTDLFAVAVHEFGHALGLSHSSIKESIMMPYYQGPVGSPELYQLPQDDAMGIEQLYGKRPSGSYPDSDIPKFPVPTDLPIPDLPPDRPTQGPRPPSPDRCEARFDAIANIRGEVFFFKKKHFWRLQPSQHLVSLEPAQTLRFWNGLPQDFKAIDAAYERANDSQIVFFIGPRFWVFTNTQVNPGYPRPVSDLGLPPRTVVGAVFVWPHNGKTYLFEKDQYWRYDDRMGRVEQGYPKPVSLWKGVPNDLDDITSWNEGDTYFFKDTQFWKFTGGSVESDAGYPRFISHHWLHCEGPATSPPPSPRQGPEKGMCLCGAAAPKAAPVLAFGILAFLWAVGC